MGLSLQRRLDKLQAWEGQDEGQETITAGGRGGGARGGSVPLSRAWGDSPMRVPLMVPFPWQFSTRRLRTLAPAATPASRPLSTPAMWVPWLSHLLAWRRHRGFTPPAPLHPSRFATPQRPPHLIPLHPTPCASHQLNPATEKKSLKIFQGGGKVKKKIIILCRRRKAGRKDGGCRQPSPGLCYCWDPLRKQR